MQPINKKIKKITREFLHYDEQISWLVSGLILIICLTFMYNNFFKAIGDANVVIKLKNQAATQVIKIDVWEKINQDLEWKKQELSDGEDLNNPFD